MGEQIEIEQENQGGSVFSMVKKMVGSANRMQELQQSFDKCRVCGINLFGKNFMAINLPVKNGIEIGKICVDCQIKAVVKYVEDYDERLKSGK